MKAVRVQCRHVRLAYGHTEVLKDVNLDIEPGEFFALLGPSGSGKSTLLRLIAGFNRSQSGELLIDGVDITARPPWERNIGMVFQSYALWPHMTVAENIAYPLAAGRMSKAEIAGKIAAMLDWIGLAGMGGRYIHELSGGQQQRVSLGRAMIGGPRAILFDEPLSNLDARLREHMRMELLALRQKVPFTSIYVTHDLMEAMTLGDRVVVMRAGKVEQMGTPEEIYRRPRNRFTAAFVGIPNLLEGRVRGVAGSDVLVETALGMLKTRGWRTDAAIGAPCTVAVRATLLALEPGGAGGRIVRTAFQGSSSLVLVDLAGTEIAVESFAEIRPKDGAPVAVRPGPDAVFPLLDD